ncbi:MAG: Maf family protein [Treponema sp.]|jgi:septum formation protein|nr:Maf family protein [Treponema sp.]
MEPIILASGSPRRQEFFRLLALPFVCMPSMIDETPLAGLNPRQATEELALRKTMSVVARLERESPPEWVFGADTVVVLGGEVFGKPGSRDAARAMLERLAGRSHEVITAMALYNGRVKKTDCRSAVAEVRFAPLAAADIEWYLGTGEWEGAAGAYRLQELGAVLIESIKGSPSAVAGLPLRDFYVMLSDNGYSFGA